MKRTVEVSSPGSHLHLETGSLVITRDRMEVARVPLEDLGTLILADPAITVTAALLSALSGQGGVTVVAGPDFQPEGTLLPMRANCTRGERVRAQVRAKRPLEKQLWARIVRAKIRNQAALLGDAAERRALLNLASRVRSGDPTNLEARAARGYWPLVFHGTHATFELQPFRRSRSGEWPNNYLNYGYAILRAITARALCGAGLTPEVGLHHHNRYDSFALASDAMEPFRPWVDSLCRELVSEGPGELTRESKRQLLAIFEVSALMEGGTTPLPVAVERMASSLASAYLQAASGAPAQQAAEALRLPAFPPTSCA